MKFFTSSISTTVHRIEQGGIEYLIAPVVAIVPGVLNGELATAEEISHFVESWNGIPVPLGHPTDSAGEFASANTPEVIAESPGRFYNAEFTDGKLKGEIWFDMGKVNEMNGVALETIERIERGEPVEVSTAYFRDPEETPGSMGGEDYSIIQRNLRPDHLALLPDEIGACSWFDGCGVPRTNAGLSSNCKDCPHRRKDDMPEPVQNVEESLTDRLIRIRKQFYAHVRPQEIGGIEFWVSKIYSNIVIAEQGDRLVGFPYTEDDEGVVSFGEPQEVEIVYQDVESGESVIGNADLLAGFLINTEANTMAEEAELAEGETEAAEEEELETTEEGTTETDETGSEETTEPVQGNQGLRELAAMIADLGGVKAVKAAIQSVQVNEQGERERLTAILIANESNPFTAEELGDLPIPHLKKLAGSFQPKNYEGMGVAFVQNEEGNGFDNPMPPTWEEEEQVSA